MIRTLVLLATVLAIIAARPDKGDWYNTNYTKPYPTRDPYPTEYPTREPSPLDQLKRAVGKLLYKAEELVYDASYRIEDEAIDFAEEIEDSVVERVVGLAELIEEISDEHLDY